MIAGKHNDEEGEAMLLTVKVTNAETLLGVFDGDELCALRSEVTRTPRTADELGDSIDACLMHGGLDYPDLDGAVLCSVVPTLTAEWRRALADATGERPVVVGPGAKSGIAMQYKDPAQMGADRVADAVGARELVGAPVVVVEFDAVTAFSVVNKEGAFAGGLIAPGVGSSLDALYASAAQLPEVSMRRPRHVIARTTADAICAGAVLGEAARIDGLVDAIWDELGYETALVATGPYAHDACAAVTHRFEVDETATLIGLRAIWNLNQRSR